MRLEGWEGRLAEVIEAARRARYELGVHDCFRVACAAVQALTGEDRWPLFAGRYSSKRQALALLARYGSSFDAAASWFFGSQPLPVPMARQGDVVKFVDAAGESHLGICIAAEVAVLGPGGLVFIARSACACAWRVG